MRTAKILVLTVDDFGAQVADRLVDEGDVHRHDASAGTHPSLWPAADLMLLAGAAEQPRTADAIDETAFRRGRPWIGLCVRGTEIQVGPVVRPGHSACRRCFVRRRAQHLPPGAAALAQPAGAPAGFARHHVAAAAALMRASIAEALGEREPAAPGGTVRIVSQVSGAVHRAGVVGVDGCSRCGARFSAGRGDLWALLEPALGPVSRPRPLVVAPPQPGPDQTGLVAVHV